MAKSKTKPKKTPAVPPPVDKMDAEFPVLTQALLRRWHYVNRKRRELNREADKLDTEEKEIKAVVNAWLTNRAVESARRPGYRITRSKGAVIVRWKDAFIRLCGAEAAKKLTDGADHSVVLKIEEVE